MSEEGSMAERERPRLSRRDFMRRAGAGALAVPSLGAILAACTKPGTETSGAGTTGRVLARPDNPVELPMNGDPISASTPVEEGATLQVYNWFAYMYRYVLNQFEKEYNCTIEWTTFQNMEEGIQKVQSGQVQPDVFFPTVDYVSRLAEQNLIQPLQHELLPNMEANVWKAFWDPGPFYDLGWRYTVPYTIYTTGVAYRRDKVSDDAATAAGYNLLWDAAYKDKISYYDSYRDALGMAMIRNGVTDPNTGDQAAIDAAKASVLELVNDLGARLTINGAFAKLPEGEYTVAQSWSGDIVGAKWYLPKDTSEDVLGFWFPEDHKGLIGNDTIAVMKDAKNPVLAHKFLDWFLDKHWGRINFTQWNGYQPPFTSINPTELIDRGTISPHLGAAVVTEDMFTQGYVQGELSAEVDALWLDAWSEITSGG
jgi:spermidine/putrescine transport system substrate-binding protein